MPLFGLFSHPFHLVCLSAQTFGSQATEAAEDAGPPASSSSAQSSSSVHLHVPTVGAELYEQFHSSSINIGELNASVIIQTELQLHLNTSSSFSARSDANSWNNAEVELWI
jgi:hypothetical protein